MIWTNTDWKQREGSTTTLTIAGDVLISGTQWGGLYGNDIRTGKQLWKLSDNGLGNRGASPVYKDGKLWLISSKSFFLIEPQTGKVLQQKELSANLDVTSTPLVTEQEIIFGSADRGVFALDKPTLFIKWRAETLPSLVYTAPYSSTPQAGVNKPCIFTRNCLYRSFRRVFIRHRPVNRDYQRQVVLRSTSFLNDSRIGKQNDSL